MAFTTRYNIELADPGQDTSTWGQITNGAIDGLDGELFRVEALVGGKLNTSGGTLTGALSGTSASFPNGITGPLSGTVTGSLNGLADRTTRLQTPRSFSIAGVATAPAVTFDGTGNVVLNLSIADDALSIGKVAGLSDALAGKEPTLAANRKRVIYVQAAAPSNPVENDIWFDLP